MMAGLERWEKKPGKCLHLLISILYLAWKTTERNFSVKRDDVGYTAYAQYITSVVIKGVISSAPVLHSKLEWFCCGRQVLGGQTRLLGTNNELNEWTVSHHPSENMAFQDSICQSGEHVNATGPLKIAAFFRFPFTGFVVNTRFWPPPHSLFFPLLDAQTSRSLRTLRSTTSTVRRKWRRWSRSCLTRPPELHFD